MKSYWIRVMSLSLASGVLALCGFGAVGCETVQGAGEDIENVGEGMEDAAD